MTKRTKKKTKAPQMRPVLIEFMGADDEHVHLCIPAWSNRRVQRLARSVMTQEMIRGCQKQRALKLSDGVYGSAFVNMAADSLDELEIKSVRFPYVG